MFLPTSECCCLVSIASVSLGMRSFSSTSGSVAYRSGHIYNLTLIVLGLRAAENCIAHRKLGSNWMWICEPVRPLFHLIYFTVKFCVHQYIRGGTGPSAQRHWRKECDKSQPDLQLPQEQDVQKDQGEFLLRLQLCSLIPSVLMFSQ